jgi:hypothetical protein
MAGACKVDFERPATLPDRSFLILMSSHGREQCKPTRSSDNAFLRWSRGGRALRQIGDGSMLGCTNVIEKWLFVEDDRYWGGFGMEPFSAPRTGSHVCRALKRPEESW